MIDLKTIKNAHNRIKNIVHNTPFVYAPILSNMSGYDIFLKKENDKLYKNQLREIMWENVGIIRNEKNHCKKKL